MPYAPERLISTLADMLSAQNEKHLSRLIRLSTSMIEGIRAGTIAVTPTLLQHIADAIEVSVETLRVILGERRQKARMAVLRSAVTRPA